MRSLRRAVLRTCLAVTLTLTGCQDEGSYTPFPPYFAFDGTQTFVASRNIAGRSVEEIEALLDKARDEGRRWSAST